MITSEAEASQGYETIIETLSNFDVSSVRNKEAVLIDTTQNKKEMQVWTQRVTDNTNIEMAELINELNEKMMRELKKHKRMHTVPNRKNNEQATSRIHTLKCINNNDIETNASDTEDQESRIQYTNFRPSKTNELRTPIQLISIQNLD